MAESRSRTLYIVLAVVVLAAAGAGGGYLYYRNLPKSAPSLAVVAVDDNVTVNYIGLFGSGPQIGKVFDTSIFAVGSNNASYPKSLLFQARGVEKNYTPLGVHVGSDVPSSGSYTYNGITFAGVVPGFWEGLVGVPGNQTRTLIIPPDLGYGPLVPACTRTLPLRLQLPVVEMIPGTQFQKEFPGILATTGTTFPDPHYGWTDLILSANASAVTLENVVSAGWVASPAGWPIVVTNVSSAANGTAMITLVNEITPADAGLLIGKDYLSLGPSGTCHTALTGKFVLSAVSLTNGTYTENFDRNPSGQTLVFVVNVVNIFAPGNQTAVA